RGQSAESAFHFNPRHNARGIRSMPWRQQPVFFLETPLNLEKAVGHEKAQKPQRKEGFVLEETFTVLVTRAHAPPCSFCDFCAFSRPLTAAFRLNCLPARSGICLQ